MKGIRTVIFLMLTIALLRFSSWYETHYTREATVIAIDNSIITVIDNCDYIWEFEGTGFSVGDTVRMTMDTMNTDTNIFDDAIENVKIINE